ncbi:cAMP response element binding [Desmophyllum pertusum]|uniref:cAMP response element binding n=1 Tax=Desmophyllum pertusum TaxID=174260 RepID=A0A9W9ZP65_9CNID|nr:cAMP response element binding [Desmophyllum pertusum]
MVVDVSSSTVSLDHLYAKKDILLEEDLFSSSSDFLNTWAQDNYTSHIDDDGLLDLLFGQDFADFGDVSPQRSESTSSDSYMTPSPTAMDDVELSEILSSTSASPGLPQSHEDFTIDLDWNVDFDLPADLEDSMSNDSELTTITASLPTTVTSSIVATSQSTTSVCLPSASHTSKSKILVLSSEEQRLLDVEGVAIPTDLPLTKAEEKVLKKVRRKIKNKQSAQESRKKKKTYVDGLEERVKACTQLNHNLSLKVNTLEKQNKSLLDQLKDLQALVASTHPTKAQAGTCLMVLFLAFGLVLFPINNTSIPGEQKSSVASYAPAIVRSRTLLQVQEEYPDEHPEMIQFNLSSDYLKAAAPLTSQNTASLGEVSVEVSEIERKSQDNKIKAQKR